MGIRDQQEAHEPPTIARATLAVHRDPFDESGAWGEVDEQRLAEGAADRGHHRAHRAADWGDAGDGYSRPSKHRACMPYGATETNERAEERDCPELLERFRRLAFRRPKPTSEREVARALSLSFGAIDEGDFRPLLDGGWERIYVAFRPWVDHPMARAALDGDPCDRELRRRRAGGPRSAFGSAVDVLSAASFGAAVLGVGQIDLERLGAESKGRTRARWDEIFCQPTRAGGGTTKGLGAVERHVDAQRGLRGVDLSEAERAGLIEAADRLPLEQRLLSFRARVAGWELSVGRTAPNYAIDEIRAVTKDLSDDAIRKSLTRARECVEQHLRRLPAAGQRALAEGRRDLLADETQLLSLIPPKNDRPRKKRERKKFVYREGVRMEVTCG